MKLVLLGPPGAGKGTQAVRIAQRYSLAYISTGDMLRAEIAFKTPLGMKAKALIDAGELVPDDIINEMVENRISQDDCAKGFLLDGYPRTVAQAEELHDFGDIDRVILISVPAEEIIERMTCRRVCPLCRRTYSVHHGEEYCECGARLIERDDDKPETVRHRLDVYEHETFPLVDFYKSKDMLIEVDGLGDVESVSDRIFKQLDGIIGNE